jgi:hypothetical protein
MPPYHVALLRNTCACKLEAPSLTASGRGTSLAAADFDGDLRSDVVMVDGAAITVLRGDGKGGFLDPVVVSKDLSPDDVAVADFNHDGAPDIVVAGADDMVHVLVNTTK